ncbi:acyl carrier protein [Streptomyces sp. ISL-86]|uniref:acyl carrier protein n=1 Tax=Streptomyces sp. ISL-86 TaxID=2819187 RepID=UPI001BE8E395|nr:acyl carrier protein [Streptomyces sp. ISL-86]MBT2453667.1 acyl carrier protein [Streptomyces sp. ISL-86]
MPETMLDLVLAAASAVFACPARADEDFFALGGDSIAAVELAVRLEEALGVAVETELILDAEDFTALAAALTGVANGHPDGGPDGGPDGARAAASVGGGQ